MQNIIELIENYKDRKVVLLPHYNADLDALASCYILSKIFHLPIAQLNKPVENGYNFIKLFNLDILTSFQPENYDLIIFVDSCDIIQFDNITPSNSVVIDHHLGLVTHPIPNLQASYIKRKADYISCTSMIYDKLIKPHFETTPLLASAIIAGFIGDGGWVNATAQVRSQIESLLEISYFDLQALSSLNEHEKVRDKTEIAKITQTMRSIDYFQFENLDFAFVEAEHRKDFFFVNDQLLNKMDISVIISKVWENDQNIIRFEKIDERAKQQLNLKDWFLRLEKSIDHDYFKHEYRRFSSKESWKNIQSKIRDSLSA